jgi:hypothetical protein
MTATNQRPKNDKKFHIFVRICLFISTNGVSYRKIGKNLTIANIMCFLDTEAVKPLRPSKNY